MAQITLTDDAKIIQSNFEEIMEKIGWFGKFTVRLYLVMYLTITYGAMNIVGAVFLAADVQHYCAVDSDVVQHVQQKCQLNWNYTHYYKSLPTKDNTTSHCEKYVGSALFNLSCLYWEDDLYATNISTEACSKWWYNRSTFSSTAAIDFNLVCDQKWLKEFSQFLLMFGILIGATLCGIISDRCGRSSCFLVCLIILLLSSVLTSAVQVFWLYLLLRLLVGIGSIGLCISGIVYVMEITSVRHRVLINQAFQATFSFGFMFLALFGFLERRWIYLNLIISLPFTLLAPLYLCWSRESPRWLLSRSQSKKSLNVLEHMAAVNGKSLNDILEDVKTKRSSMVKDTTESLEEGNMLEESKALTQKLTTLDLFRCRSLRFISVCLMYNWFTVTCIYYGLTLNTASLNGNVFLNFFLGGLVELPANFGVVPVVQWWGRRPVICICNLICGISLLCSAFLPADYTAGSIVLFLMGKFGVTATFSCIYLYSSELYPTPLRGNGLGVCSGSSRVGGLVSLLVIMLRHVNPAIPSIVFGALALLAGVVVVLLPETKGFPLPETVEDVEKLHKHRKITLAKQFLPTFA